MVGGDWISRKREYTMTVMIYYQYNQKLLIKPIEHTQSTLYSKIGFELEPPPKTDGNNNILYQCTGIWYQEIDANSNDNNLVAKEIQSHH